MLLGGQDRQLSVNQFVLQDGRTYRTQGSHERLQATCDKLGNPELAERAFGENHGTSITAKEKNSWKPTPATLLPDIQKTCVEHGHGGPWNPMGYDSREVSIDMKACYSASFQGMGEAKSYFERFGHPTHRMTRVAINGLLPKDIDTGFVEIQEWDFDASCHPDPYLVWKAFRRCLNWRLGPDAALGVPHRVWPAEVPQSQGGDNLLLEED
ncbi:MAG: hypothetical protein AB2556_23525 [Candidatus Thiodiazotropha sp.]